MEIIGASVIGKKHLTSNSSCEDNCMFEIYKNIGIIAVSDGAGSNEYSFSELGSLTAVETVINEIKNLVDRKKIRSKKILSQPEWEKISLKLHKTIYEKICEKSNEVGTEANTLSCTLICIVFTKKYVLSMNIGDGRAGYRNSKGNYFSLFKPFQGDQVGMTVFITSKIVLENPELYISANTFKDKIESVFALSDGMENYCWECNFYNEEEKKYYDPNMPFTTFFDQNIKTLKDLLKSKSKEETINAWRDYIDSGHPKFKEEQDDKTLVIGIV
jgi:hypothetical protein